MIGGQKKQKGWIEILPRFKIQYPMKNQSLDVKQDGYVVSARLFSYSQVTPQLF